MTDGERLLVFEACLELAHDLLRARQAWPFGARAELHIRNAPCRPPSVAVEIGCVRDGHLYCARLRVGLEFLSRQPLSAARTVLCRLCAVAIRDPRRRGDGPVDAGALAGVWNMPDALRWFAHAGQAPPMQQHRAAAGAARHR